MKFSRTTLESEMKFEGDVACWPCGFVVGIAPMYPMCKSKI